MFSILRPNYKPVSPEIREIIRRSTDDFCERKLKEATFQKKPHKASNSSFN
jgi:hypothetical protein